MFFCIVIVDFGWWSKKKERGVEKDDEVVFFLR
jgi:hypothetical protein